MTRSVTHLLFPSLQPSLPPSLPPPLPPSPPHQLTLPNIDIGLEESNILPKKTYILKVSLDIPPVERASLLTNQHWHQVQSTEY